ncbi:SMP-30/gluconolactonase/LRE family protein [Mucilaginibacter gynuensis]|uniref:SMP-30/gluconolactonase/LRE family protein n=1 Tax=Mucilaginibacter gynuensis TaxID=1302236 RepID=A0ABP8FR59_9SPHI
MRRTYTFAIACLLAFTGKVSAQEKPLYDTLLKAKLVSKDFAFTEGPTSNKQGDVFFTDQPNNKIWKYSTDGKLSLFMENSGRANGMFFNKKGDLLVCADEHNQLWSVGPDGKVKVLVKDLDGKLLNGPNDVWQSPSGGIYFTDPYYQRDYWTRKQPDVEGQKVYYVPKGSDKPIVADDKIKQPNGIIGSPDGKYLYVGDIGDSKIYRYTITKDGSLTDRKFIANHQSDGMTLDVKGNIYVSGKGVTIYNPEGKKLAHIDIPEPWTGNVCFSGKNHDILFITASKAIYTLQMQVRGLK